MNSVNDIVLIYIDETPFTFARIEDINPDHKKGWYHVTLLFLQIPLQTVSWLIRDAYIDGEAFTMNGKKVRLEKIEPYKPPLREASEEPKQKPKSPKNQKAKVISFSEFKK